MLHRMQKNGIGCQPEYGAIFMSNSVTKKECLRRKLFGLPPKHGHFVKQVKAGMILFLFEFEKRQLYGVFEACSDGGIDIVPHAFSTSGLNCPAQVKVKCIWICHPLSECEFRDAIMENYFTAKKFNFGLSEVQVLSLLQLFSFKKLGVPPRLAKRRDAKLIVHSTEEGMQVDGGVNDDDECVYGFNNMDIEVRPTTTAGHLLLDSVEIGHSKYQFRDVPSDGGFQMNNEIQNEGNSGFGIRPAATTEHSKLDKFEQQDNKFPVYGWGMSEHCPDKELLSTISAHQPEYYPRYVSRVPGDDRFLMNDEFQNENNRDNCFEPSVLSEYSPVLQSKLGRSALAGKHLEIRNSGPDQTSTQSFPIRHQMLERLLSNTSSKASYRDTVVVSTQPYESVVLRVNYPHPSVKEVNCQSVAEGYQPCYGYSNNAISVSTIDPFLSHAKGNGMTQCMGKLSTVRDHAAFSGPTPSHDLYQGNTMGLSQTYSKSWDPELAKENCYSCPIPSFRTNIDARENNSSGYTPARGIYPSLLDVHGYHVEPEDQPQNEVAGKRKRESFVGNIPSACEDPFTLQASLSSVNSQSLQDYEHNLSMYDRKHYQSSDALYTWQNTSRTSVFSRLDAAQDAHVPENNPTDCYKGNKTFKMLHNSHRQWVKSKKPKQWKRQVDVEKITSKRQTADFRGVIVNGPRSWAKPRTLDFSKAEPDREVGISLAGMKQATQLAEMNSFFNFKRRSEVRKHRHNGMAAICDASSSSEAVLGGPLKKRKLVRPNFGTCASYDDKDVKKCTSILQKPAEEISITNDNIGGCEVSTENQVGKNTTSLLSSKETPVICQCTEEHIVNNFEKREDGEVSGAESPVSKIAPNLQCSNRF